MRRAAATAAAIAQANSMTPTARRCQHTSAHIAARLIRASEHLNTCSFTTRARTLASNNRAIFTSRIAAFDKEQQG